MLLDGSGIDGLIEGIQAGQGYRANALQMKLSKARDERAGNAEDRAETNQGYNDEKMEEFRKQLERNNEERSTQRINEGVYDFARYGNLSGVKDAIKKDPDFLGADTTVRQVEDEDYLTDGKFDMKKVNAYQQQTGNDAFEGYRNEEGFIDQDVTTLDPSKFKDSLPKRAFIMTNAEEGDQWADVGTLRKGAPNIDSYFKKREQADALIEAKINKANATKTPKFDKNEVANTAMTEMSQLSNDPAYVELTTGLDNGGVLDLKNPLVQKLQLLENQSGNTYKNAPLDATITGLADMNQAYADVNDMYKKEGFNSGITKSMASDIAKLGSDDSKLTPSEQMKQFNTIIMKSKLGGAMSRYLKAISGSAVTEEEFLRTMKNAVGGDISKVNAQTIMTAMKSTIDSMGKTAREQIDGIQPGTPMSKLWRKSRYNQAMNPKASNPKFDSRQSGNQTIEQVGADAVKEEVTAATNFGSKVVGAGADAIGNVVTEKIIDPLKKKAGGIVDDITTALTGGDKDPLASSDDAYTLGNNLTEQVKNLGKVGELKLKEILSKITNKQLTREDATKELKDFLNEQPSSFGR